MLYSIKVTSHRHAFARSSPPSVPADGRYLIRRQQLEWGRGKSVSQIVLFPSGVKTDTKHDDQCFRLTPLSHVHTHPTRPPKYDSVIRHAYLFRFFVFFLLLFPRCLSIYGVFLGVYHLLVSFYVPRC